MKSAMVGRWGGLGRSRALLSRLVRRHMAAGSMGITGALLRDPMLELREPQLALSHARRVLRKCSAAGRMAMNAPKT